MTPTPVHEFGTAFMRTSVYRNGAEFAWVRRPGPAYRLPLPDLPARLGALLGSVHPALSLPVIDDGLRYRSGGALPAAGWLAFDEEPAGPVLESALREIATALAGLHARPAPPQIVRRHPGVTRLAAWFDDRHDAAPAFHLSHRARKRLGRTRWTRLEELCGQFCAAGGDTLLHGALSMALIVPSPDGTGVLLTGEDLARGPWWLDLGWLIAELIELDQAVKAGIAPALDFTYPALCAALLEGYGRTPDLSAIGGLGVLRVLTHARDYATYVGWDDQLLTYVDIAAVLFDEQIGEVAARAMTERDPSIPRK
ncbi:hypothetical protein [Streptosporangium sp. NPDC087985]|uniref:hypothetical protein n=1 Tax=Streptosporangium sp. NPDC087985 TaxID=3366196 RepID=UPI00381206F3